MLMAEVARNQEPALELHSRAVPSLEAHHRANDDADWRFYQLKKARRVLIRKCQRKQGGWLKQKLVSWMLSYRAKSFENLKILLLVCYREAEIVETTFRSRFHFRFLKYPLSKKVVSFRVPKI